MLLSVLLHQTSDKLQHETDSAYDDNAGLSNNDDLQQRADQMAALEGGGADSSSYNNSYNSSQSAPASAGSARRLSASAMVRAVLSSSGRRASASPGALHLAHDHDHSPGAADAQQASPTDSYIAVVHDDDSSLQHHYKSSTVTAATAAAATLPPLPPAPHRATTPPIQLPNVNDYSRVGLPDAIHDDTAIANNSSNSEYRISSSKPGLVGSTLADLSSKELSRSLHGPKRNQQQQQLQQQQATGPYSTASTATASSGSSMKPPPVTAKSSTAAATATSAHVPLRTDRPWWQQWRGNSKFFMKGRVMLGSHYQQLWLTNAMISGTWLLFFVFVAPNYRGAWIWWCGLLLYITCLITLAQTALTEPGYLPPKPRSTAIETMPAAVREKVSCFCIDVMILSFETYIHECM
jgi:hypothetical protein